MSLSRAPALPTTSPAPDRAGRWARAIGFLRGVLRNRAAAVGCAIVATLIILALGADLMAPYGAEEQFADRYRNRAVLFDDVVRRDAAGTHHLSVYEVRGPGEPARIDLGGLKVLESLPLERPQRMLFGARLAAVTREPPGQWVISFEPDSGVLLTDEAAAATCCPQPFDDDLRAVLKRQAEWTASLP